MILPADKLNMLRYMKIVAAVVILVCLSIIVVQLNSGEKPILIINQVPPDQKIPETLEPRSFELKTTAKVTERVTQKVTEKVVTTTSKSAEQAPMKVVENQSSPVEAKKPRVLCLVTTTPNNHKTKAVAVKETWGARCDHLIFVSSKYESGLPVIVADCDKEDHDHLWCKNRNGIVQAHKLFDGQYDWFMKADDDTYVVMENLKYLVGSHDPNEPVWFGCPFNYPGQHHIKYHSGGAGYVLSHEAIVRLIKAFDTPKEDCDAHKDTGPDDLYLGSCFEKTGVKFGDERDELGRPRFFPFSPQTWLNPRVSVYNTTEWFKHYSVHHYKMGKECCSDTSISFHYISAEDMYVYDFFLYRMRVHK